MENLLCSIDGKSLLHVEKISFILLDMDLLKKTWLWKDFAEWDGKSWSCGAAR